jgi:methylated-DNA-protein-cysteine methyltransferase-like protein
VKRARPAPKRTQEESIFAAIRAIPRGHVATYGQVAELAGIPRGHRVVARVLRDGEPKRPVPWQRVMGKRGSHWATVQIQDLEGADLQRAMLEREGVTFDAAGRVDLRRFGVEAL